MTSPNLPTPEQIIVQLAMVSHVSGTDFDRGSASTDEDIGGKRPPGGVDRQGDRKESYRQKTAEYFARRLARCTGDAEREALRLEAERALYDWRHTPEAPNSAELAPERGSFLWKCRVADDDRPLEKIKEEYWVSRATVYRYRQKYRGLRRAA